MREKSFKKEITWKIVDKLFQVFNAVWGGRCTGEWMKKKHWDKVRCSTEIIELMMHLHSECKTLLWQDNGNFLVKEKTHSHIDSHRCHSGKVTNAQHFWRGMQSQWELNL